MLAPVDGSKLKESEAGLARRAVAAHAGAAAGLGLREGDNRAGHGTRRSDGLLRHGTMSKRQRPSEVRDGLVSRAGSLGVRSRCCWGKSEEARQATLRQWSLRPGDVGSRSCGNQGKEVPERYVGGLGDEALGSLGELVDLGVARGGHFSGNDFGRSCLLFCVKKTK